MWRPILFSIPRRGHTHNQIQGQLQQQHRDQSAWKTPYVVRYPEPSRGNRSQDKKKRGKDRQLEKIQKQVMQPPPQEHHHHHKPLETEDISSPLKTRLLEFCEDELFAETMPGSEVSSCSNCYLEDYNIDATNLSLTRSTDEFSNILQDEYVATTPMMTIAMILGNHCQSMIFYSPDDMEKDISASTDFSPSPSFSVPPILCTQDEQFEFSDIQHLQLSPLPPQFQMSNIVGDTLQNNHHDTVPLPPIVIGHHVFPSVYEDKCLSSVPSYIAMNPPSPSCSFFSPRIRSYVPTNMNPALSADVSAKYTGSILVNSDMQTLELDFQAENNGLFCPDSTQLFGVRDFQGFWGESQNIGNGHGGSTPLPSDMSRMEDSTFKVGKLSVEQRKEKIHRYMKKRNERNFSKKIKYACRKTLADSRPRVRGRFAKNDEPGDNLRHACGNHEGEDKEEVTAVIREDEIIDSPDLFALISGVNSFNCGYPVHSWI